MQLSNPVQGGDWGAIVVDQMGLQALPELLGIHTSMPCVIPAEIDAAAFAGKAAPAGLSADEKHVCEMVSAFYKDVYYALFMGTRPTEELRTGLRSLRT